MTLKQMMARLDVCMGGRIAEEVMFGKENVTSGASSDIQQATRLARAMVTKYGLSDKIGAVFINNDPSQNDRGTRISDETLQEVDNEIKRLCDESYTRVTKLLQDNKHKLINVAEGLIKYETLAGAEVVELANTGKLVADGTNGKVRSQKPSRALKQIPTEGVGGPRKRLAPTHNPAATPRQTPASKPQPKPQPLQRKATTPKAEPAAGEKPAVPPNPLGGFSSWFSAPSSPAAANPTTPPATPAGTSGTANINNRAIPSPPALTRGSTSTSTEVRVRNINGKMVEESTTTVVSKDPQTGAVSRTTTRRIRGPPVIVDQNTPPTDAEDKKSATKEDPKKP